MNENRNKIKDYVYRIIIALVLSLMAWGIITGGFNKVELLSSGVQDYRTVEVIESREAGTGQEVLRKHSDGGGDKQVQEVKQGQAKPVLIHKGFATGDIRQEYINYAYQLGGENLTYLIMCENGNLDPKLQSRVVKNGVREASYGLCQIHKHFYPEIVNDKRFLTDRRWQLEQCRKIRSGGGLFFGPTRKVKGEPCYIWASKQLLINYK